LDQETEKEEAETESKEGLEGTLGRVAVETTKEEVERILFQLEARAKKE
jgi:hypothetical protein